MRKFKLSPGSIFKPPTKSNKLYEISQSWMNLENLSAWILHNLLHVREFGLYRQAHFLLFSSTIFLLEPLNASQIHPINWIQYDGAIYWWKNYLVQAWDNIFFRTIGQQILPMLGKNSEGRVAGFLSRWSAKRLMQTSTIH